MRKSKFTEGKIVATSKQSKWLVAQYGCAMNVCAVSPAETHHWHYPCLRTLSTRIPSRHDLVSTQRYPLSARAAQPDSNRPRRLPRCDEISPESHRGRPPAPVVRPNHGSLKATSDAYRAIAVRFWADARRCSQHFGSKRARSRSCHPTTYGG